MERNLLHLPNYICHYVLPPILHNTVGVRTFAHFLTGFSYPISFILLRKYLSIVLAQR
jgi:hypothetical protein